MKILFLTQWFDPEPTPKGLLFAKKLCQHGHTVEVLTAIPNYPHGKYYPGYRFRLFQQEMIDGVRVIRVPIYPSHDKSALKRIFTYLSFSFFAMVYGLFATKKADLIYAYHPPNVGFVAALLSLIKQIPFVHDIQDLWPDSFVSTGMIKNKFILTIINIFCRWVYKRASVLIVISPGFKRELIARKVPQEKIKVIYNWCDEAKITKPRDILENPMADNGKFNILFAGNMGKAQNLSLVIDAAKILMGKRPEIQFNFVGAGLELEFLKKYTSSSQISNVEFIPGLPMDQIGALLTSADVLLVHLKPDPLFEITIPSKIQAYLAIGKPVLISVGGDAANIIKEAEAGLVAVPGNVGSLVEACESFLDMEQNRLLEMGLNGKHYYYNHFSLDVGVGNIEKIFKRVISA